MPVALVFDTLHLAVYWYNSLILRMTALTNPMRIPVGVNASRYNFDYAHDRPTNPLRIPVGVNASRYNFDYAHGRPTNPMRIPVGVNASRYNFDYAHGRPTNPMRKIKRFIRGKPN